MSTRTKRFMTVLAVAVLAMAMYGCSSDGDSGVSQAAYDELNDELTDTKQDLEDTDQALKDALANQREDLPAPGTDAYAMATALQDAIDSTTVHNFAPTAVTAEVGEMVAITLTETGTPASGTARSGDFVQQMEGPSSITGWAGASLVRDTGTVAIPDTRIENVAVYTDIAAPTSLSFNTANVAMLAGASALTVSEEGEIATVDLTTSSAYGQHVMLDVATPDDASRTYQAVVNPDNSAVFDLALDGTFGGADGKYSCTGAAAADCQIVVATDGAVTPTGTWKFTAVMGAMIALADADYLYFGWWVEAPGEDDQAFQTFAGATGAGLAQFTGGNVLALDGKATYQGAAAGVYVLRDIGSGAELGADSGEFTATAGLSVNFADASQAGFIDGSITDFMDDAGESMNGWRVTLEDIFLTAGNSAFSGETSAEIGPETAGSGTWSGAFFGDGAVATDLPMAVAGQFDADFPGARIAGAFGAMLSEE